jgi:hypothetical protein
LHQVGPSPAGSDEANPNPDGDTPQADTDADARLWPEVPSFLADPARQTGTFTAPATPLALNSH